MKKNSQFDNLFMEKIVNLFITRWKLNAKSIMIMPTIAGAVPNRNRHSIQKKILKIQKEIKDDSIIITVRQTNKAYCKFKLLMRCLIYVRQKFVLSIDISILDHLFYVTNHDS